jgi:acyl-CoA thioesterase
MDVDAHDPQAVADFCAAAMWTDDHASRQLGMTIERVGPGTAELSMTVTREMSNGHGTAHGGYIFALADSAFAFACNSRGPRAVAAQCHVAYLRPGRTGDRLVATAVEVVREGRSSIYDVHVRCADQVVAEFRGHARQIGGSWLDGLTPQD